MAASVNNKHCSFKYINMGELFSNGDHKFDSLSDQTNLFPSPLTLYLCFTSQLVLLGFYHDSFLFTSPVFTLEYMTTGIVKERGRERVHMVGVPERIGAL